jgi:hypothetical protein
MKKILISLMIVLGLFSQSVYAQGKTYDWLVMGTPGGTAYDNAELIIPQLEKQGIKINKIIVDSCVGGSIYMKKSKNPTIYIQYTLEHATPGCELQATENSFIGNGWGRAMAFCSNDSLEEAVAKLKGGKRLTFAVSNSYGQHLIDPLAAVTKTPMKFVPYGSSGKSVSGFLAGDTDMLYTNMPKAISAVKKNGVKCWANTGPTKILDMVPMTSLFPDYKYANLQAFTYINGNNLSDADMKNLRSIWNKVITGSVMTEYMEQQQLVNPKDYSKSVKDDVNLMTEAGLAWKAN